jgi:hypothetical protein
MRRLVLAAWLLTVMPSIAGAAPCLPGTLESYIGLGAGGCEVGGALFSNFTSGTSLFGGTEIDAGDISVTPFDLGLDFALDASAAANELTGVAIAFQVSGVSLGSAALSMTGASATPSADPFETGGVVTAVQDLCVGSAFAPFPFCEGTSANNIVAEDGVVPVLTDSETFAAAMLLDVVLDITIDGGTAGAAALDGVVTAEFAAGSSPPVSEPATLLLMGAGLVGIAGRFRRRAR